MDKNRKKETVIKYSCITGRAVWFYQGPSLAAAQKAYQRACKKEIERVRHLADEIAQRKASILGFLNKCLEHLGVDEELTPRQKAAAKMIVAMADEPKVPDTAFYDHIMELRRRREEDRRIRQRMRERDAAREAERKMRENPCYDKQGKE